MYIFKLSAMAMFVAFVAARGLEQCSLGTLSCCTQLQDAKNKVVQEQFGVIGAVLGVVNELLGVGCKPIGGAAAVQGDDCNITPVCCLYNGLSDATVLGCNPADANI